MRLLGRWVWVVVGVGALACEQEGDMASGSGYVLIDEDARAAGFAIRKNESILSGTLPVALQDAEQAVLLGGIEDELLEASDGELLYVTGDEGNVERYTLGRDVEYDEWDLQATEYASEELAYNLGGRVSWYHGRYRLDARDTLSTVSGMVPPRGLRGFSPVLIDNQREEEFPASDENAEAEAGLAAGGAGAGAEVEAGVDTSEGAGSESSEADLAGLDNVDTEQEYALARARALANVVGTWRGQFYSPYHEAWYEFTITVRQAALDGRMVEGEVIANSWTGLPNDRTMPSLCAGQEQWKVRQLARGSVRPNGDIRFESESWSVAQRTCGEAPEAYYPDHFEGAVSADGATWSVAVHDHHVVSGQGVRLTRVRGARR